MSHTDYHAALSSKVMGTSNLHSVSLETKQPISFFTMISSISGVIGQKGQANYAGGNAFEDAFAEYRRALGLPAISMQRPCNYRIGRQLVLGRGQVLGKPWWFDP